MKSNESNILYAPYIMAESTPLIINGLEAEEWNELQMHDVMNSGDGEQFDISWLNKKSTIKTNYYAIN